MKQNEKKSTAVILNIAKQVVKQGYEGWPPGCAAFMYQPKRPAKMSPKARKEANT